MIIVSFLTHSVFTLSSLVVILSGNSLLIVLGGTEKIQFFLVCTRCLKKTCQVIFCSVFVKYNRVLLHLFLTFAFACHFVFYVCY